MILKRGNDGVIDEDRSSKVGKSRTNLEPLTPTTQDPFGKSTANSNGWPTMYVIYLCCQEPSDSKFTKGLELCKQNCSEKVHGKCFQMDGTRHISLWDGNLTESQVREIQFTKQPKLPTVAFKPGWISWNAGNYIEVKPACTKQLKEILCQLSQPLPKGKTSGNHLSLYRKREGCDANGKRVKMDADGIAQLKRVRTALASHEWGTLEGVSIRIKQMGTDYTQCKVVAGM